MASNKRDNAAGASDSKLAADREPTAIVVLGDDDVLLGRGKGSYNHEGNIRFRKLVLARACAYRANENRTFRRAMANEIIAKITKNGGKFLRPGKDTAGGWEAVSASVARTKVKQALRDAAFALEAPSNEASNEANASAIPSPAYPLSAAAPSGSQHMLGSMMARQDGLTLPNQFHSFVPPLPTGMREQLLEQAQQDNARQLQLAALLQYSNMPPNPMISLHQQHQQQMIHNQMNLLDQHTLAQLGGASLPQPSLQPPYSMLPNFDGRSANSGLEHYLQASNQSPGIQSLLSRVSAPSSLSNLPQGFPQLGRNDLMLHATRQSLSNSQQTQEESASNASARKGEEPPNSDDSSQQRKR